ncbi:AbrB/MazE/SpoVT family DNA-binding domain-containing protein [Candidatus Saccharibacteria bacterium]|nr:AbrB/MazE/SpoVT family DNA-binding domain-containing protein [Candidatus Saccharibacteria bacterium]
MSYTVAITKSGQMTLPKALREFLGVEGARTVQLNRRGDEVVIQRKLSYDELRAEMDKHISPKAKKILAEEAINGGRPPVREIMKEIAERPAMQKQWRRKYGF